MIGRRIIRTEISLENYLKEISLPKKIINEYKEQIKEDKIKKELLRQEQLNENNI